MQTRAELELARGNAATAIKLAEQSAALPEIAPRCRGLSLLVRAQAIAATDATLATVQKAFDQAIGELAQEGQALTARAYRAYFDVLLARGSFKDAATQAQRALALLHPRAK